MAKGKGLKYKDDERVELATQICELYATDKYTLESCCKSVGVNQRTFNNWINENSEVSDIYKAARLESVRIRKNRLREKALSNMEKLIEGYSYQETIEESGTGKDGESFQKTVVKNLRTQPNATMIIFALTNTNNIEDADFCHKNKQEITGKDETPLISEITVKVVE